MRVLNERYATATSTSPTGSRSSTSAAGCRCCPIPTSRSCTCTRKGETEEASEELAGELRALVEEIVQGEAAAAANVKR